MANNSPTNRSLTAILWNANGIKQHANELEVLLHEKRVDLALISETHLSPTTQLRIQGYRIYRCDHPDGTRHGGAAVLVKSTLEHHVLPIPAQTEHIQAAAVSLSVRQMRITVAATYCPPGRQLLPEHFTELLDRLGNCFLLGGDYNAKHLQWGSRVITPRGRVLLRCIMDKQLSIHSPPQPTYWPAARNRLPDILDFFISSNLNGLRVVVDSLADLSSDHSPVLVTINSPPIITEPLPRLS
jgi:endonuclease/exonuclease/phosphatase (EEP) superfamily protein YafD